jgi:hypothetical protein
MGGVGPLRLGRPAQGEIRGDGGRTLLMDKVHELVKERPGLLQFEPESASHVEIVRQGGV